MNIPEIKSYEEQAIDTVVSVINRAKEKLGIRMTLKELANISRNAYTLKSTFLQTNFSQNDGSQLQYKTNSEQLGEGRCRYGSSTIMGSTIYVYGIRASVASDRSLTITSARQTIISRDFAYNIKLSLKPIQPPYAITSENFINDTIEHDWNLGQTFQYFVRYMGGSRDEVSQYYYFEAIFSQPTVTYPIPQATVSVFFTLQDKHIDPPEKRGVPSMWFRIEGHHTDHDMRYVALQADWILAVLQMKIKLFKRIEAIGMF